MAKTTPIRAYTEDLERIEKQRRKLSINREGRRVTVADTIRWMIELAERENEVGK